MSCESHGAVEKLRPKDVLQKTACQGSNNLHYYETFWDAKFKEERDQSYDWHREYSELREYILPYLENCKSEGVPRRDTKILNLGCGNSSLCGDLASDGFERVVNLDLSSEAIVQMKERYTSGEYPLMRFVLCDMLKMYEVLEDQMLCPLDIILDKGTMDALVSREDMIQLCNQVRLCLSSKQEPVVVGASDTEDRAPEKGVYIQVSFSFERVAFMKSVCKEFGWDMRSHVIGSGDPADGHLVHFLMIMGPEEHLQACKRRYEPNKLTQQVLQRELLFDDGTDVSISGLF